ncbi:unnamed protein product, partial [Closterium sp. NIES-54]
ARGGLPERHLKEQDLARGGGLPGEDLGQERAVGGGEEQCARRIRDKAKEDTGNGARGELVRSGIADKGTSTPDSSTAPSASAAPTTTSTASTPTTTPTTSTSPAACTTATSTATPTAPATPAAPAAVTLPTRSGSGSDPLNTKVVVNSSCGGVGG